MTVLEPPPWALDAGAQERMRAALAAVADDAVAAIIEEVPSYRGPFTGMRGQRIREAVQLALDVFLNIAMHATDGEGMASATARVAAEAYDLGRGEARAGRPMDALLAAYRIGARVSWRVLSREAISSGMPAAAVGQFAEQVFSYIDDLSAASVSGHTDELETRGRARERLLERLARSLAAGDPEPDLRRRAERADWEPPTSLTAVLLPSGNAPAVRTALDARTLQVAGDLPGLDEDTALLLVPDLSPAGRPALRRRLDGRSAVLGPTRPWTLAHDSLARARRAAALPRDSTILDTEEHLVELVLLADEQAYRDLRSSALAPLAKLRPAARARLEETLRAWLLRQGHREQVAQDLFVHPQTVRYRMGQLRDLFGATLDQPATVLALMLALGVRPAGGSAAGGSSAGGSSAGGSSAGGATASGAPGDGTPPGERQPPRSGG